MKKPIAAAEESKMSFGRCHGDSDPAHFRTDADGRMVLIACERLHPGILVTTGPPVLGAGRRRGRRCRGVSSEAGPRRHRTTLLSAAALLLVAQVGDGHKNMPSARADG